MVLITLLMLIAALSPNVHANLNEPSIRATNKLHLTTWYWLNSSPSKEWEKDFQNIKNIGITHVVLWYGWSTGLIAKETQQTQRALDLCKKTGLKAYLGIWSGTTMAPTFGLGYRLQDDQGNKLKGFNLFDQEWRENKLIPYLRKIASNYGSHPALVGYYMDDTLTLASEADANTKTVSYGKVDKERFQSWLRNKYKNIRKLNRKWNTSYKNWKGIPLPVPINQHKKIWEDWSAARSLWIKEWAKAIRGSLAIDEQEMELVLSDFHTVIDSKLSVFGIHWKDVARYFDRIMVYNINVSEKGLIKERLAKLKKEIEDQIPISWGIFTFKIGQPRSETALVPSSSAFTRQLKEILSEDISGIDFYAYDVGDWTVPYTKLKNPLLGPENPAALLKYRSDLQIAIKNFIE